VDVPEVFVGAADGPPARRTTVTAVVVAPQIATRRPLVGIVTCSAP
jgi:hypothetical protein